MSSIIDFRDEFYSRLSGPSKGYCRICGAHGKLSEDHVPPKSIFNAGPLQVRSFPYQAWSQEAKAGMKTRSICFKCNNELLGASYDPQLVEFAFKVAHDNYIRRNLLLTSGRFEYTIKTRSIAKAICGHLLSLYEPRRNLNQPIDMSGADFPSKLRRFVTMDDDEIVKETNFYCWLHPYPSIFVVSFFSMMYDFGIKEYISGSIVKFFPLSFWIVNAKDLTEHTINLPKMAIAPTDGATVSFIMDHRKVTPEKFPLDPPPEHGIILANRETSYYARRNDEGQMILTMGRP